MNLAAMHDQAPQDQQGDGESNGKQRQGWSSPL
jgi:hypothetical protein